MKQNGSNRYAGFWEGGSEALKTLKRAVREQTPKLSSKVRQERINALVGLASAYYSCVKHVGLVRGCVFLARAKRYAEQAWQGQSEDKKDLGRLSFSQLDVLSTIFLRGVKICGTGLDFAAPDPRRAFATAGKALQQLDTNEAPHTKFLLLITMARSHIERNSPDMEAVDRIRRLYDMFVPYMNGDRLDPKQAVRIVSGLGELMVRASWRPEEGHRFLRSAREKAREIAPGQVEKIDKMIAQLNRPLWHWRSWLVQVV